MAAIKVLCRLRSVSPISFSRHYEVEHLEKELPDEYEKRTWRERLHYDPKTGECFIPPMMLKHCLSESARYLNLKIKGKGNATYTKHFLAGILIVKPMMLGICKDDVNPLPLFVSADGKPGGNKRVKKYFPDIPEWETESEIFIFDPIITESIFREHLIQAGQFIGLGRFRPRVGGYYGRFGFADEDFHWNVDGGA